jgi:iron complex outermembrane receptor protein
MTVARSCLRGLGFALPLCAGAGTDIDARSLEELLGSGLAAPSQNVETATAAKYSQRSGAAPSVTRIVDAEDIRTFGYRSLAEILRSLPGLYVTHDRNYTYLGLRGFGRPSDYNSRVLLLIDGERINDAVYDGGLIGQEFPLDVDLIDRVEYAPGPGSAVYGNNAFFGVVNVISKRGHDFEGGQWSGEYGGFDTYKARGSYGKRFDNGAELLLSATGFEREGARRLHYREYDAPAQNRGDAIGLDYDRNHSAFAKLTYGGLQLEGGYIDRVKGIPTGSFDQVFNDRASKTDDAQTFIGLTYEKAMARDWRFYGRLGYHRYEYRGDYPLLPDGVVNKDRASGEWWDGELRLLNTSFERHKILFGAEMQDNLQQFQKNYDAYAVYLSQPYRSVRWGVYVQDEIALLSSLTLSAGARYDFNPLGGGSANPRIALSWRPSGASTLKLIYGTAFRAPNVFERNYQVYDFKANSALKPETVETLELALEHYFAPSTRFSASLYRNRLNQLISQTALADGVTQFDNLAKAHGLGAELELEQRFRNGVRLRLDYAVQSVRDDRQRLLTNSPAHMVKLHLSAPLWSEKWTAGMEALYMSERLTLAGRVGDHVLGNFTINGEALKNVRLSFGVYNFLNQHYADPAADHFRQDSLFQDGRSFRLKLTIGF